MKALVTGGGGYLGSAVVRALLQRGDGVISLQRGDYPALQQPGIQAVRGDIAAADSVVRAAQGCDVVYHVAGKTGIWGRYADYHHTNVAGTENVILACRENGVRALVYTSSPSVVFDGRDEAGIDESVPYPEHFYNHYQQTKAEAEQMVLAANGNGLATLALRPHLIWGPGDPHLIGRIVDRARAGKLKLINARNRVDTTYIDNAAAAHLLGADALITNDKCRGKAYFISNGEPVVLSELINRILAAKRLPPVTSYVSPGLAYLVGAVTETLYGLLGKQDEPMMTRFVARQLSCEHWFDISAARRDLGYTPTVTIDQGLERLRDA